MNNSPVVDFGKYKKEVLSDQIASRIISLIKEKHLRPGDRLPNERELASTMGVSRPSLREALRALAMMNIIENRQGSGTYITSLEPELLIQHLDFIFSINDSTFLDLIIARKAIEGGVAEIAAKNISNEEIEKLEILQAQLVENLGDIEGFLNIDLEMHKIICNSTHNSILCRIMATLYELGIYSRRRTAQSDKTREETIDHHRKILMALKRHDSLGARDAMISHLAEIGKVLSENIPAEQKNDSKSGIENE